MKKPKKRCPVCGSKKLVKACSYSGKKGYICWKCDTFTPKKLMKKHIEAISAVRAREKEIHKKIPSG